MGDRDARRAELLQAAVSVIAEEGYASTSLRNVARRAGCTTGAVTYYFSSKEKLLTALVESRFDSYDAMLEAVRDDADIESLIRRWLVHSTGDPEYWPVMSQLLAHARYEPALAAIIERRYARFRKEYASILAAGQARGVVRDDIPADLLADQLSASGDGWMLMFPFERERFTPSRVDAIVESILTLLRPPAGGGRSAAAGA
ncbi:TetR/AcrR family transcriptional regulator [Pseudonocardia sp. C8]|uniref:TetR/AcrR family transcriptional regulator n=1 Tax=Pseudonocardia sp. C8 TaxID=2762759 RepID=UPI001C92FE9B